MSRVMKDSGIAWIGKIPESWKVEKFKNLFQIKKEIAGKLGYDVLSVTQKGIKIKDITKNEGQLAQDYSKYQLVYPNDFVMNHMDLLTGYVDCSKQTGVTSPDYRTFKAVDRKKTIDKYYLRIFQFCYADAIFYKLGQGVSNFGRWRLPADQQNWFPLPFPSKEEQRAIASYLDQKCTEIDELIALQEKILDELKLYKQAVITEAVTKGLNPNAPMKDSGIEWIGEIPEHWKAMRVKNICASNNETLSDNTKEDYEFSYVDIGSVNYEKGIVSSEDFLFKNAPSRARRIAKLNDIVVSTVRTYLRAIDIIDTVGKANNIYSTGFAILSPQKNIFPKFIIHICRSEYFTFQVSLLSNGINYPSINSASLSCISVFVPPIEEQQQIASYLDRKCTEIDELANIKQQKIDELKEYKKSVIYEYVTGKKQVKHQ